MWGSKLFSGLAARSPISRAIANVQLPQIVANISRGWGQMLFGSTTKSPPPPIIHLASRTQVDMAITRKMFQQVPKVNEERKLLGLMPVINLTLGQPHLPVNTAVLKALEQKLKTPEMTTSFGYSPTVGRPETLAAIVALYKHYYPNITYANNEVMCTNGANQALWNAFSILLEEKNGCSDVMLSFSPCFVQYAKQAEVLGGRLKLIHTEKQNFRPTAEALLQSLEECYAAGHTVKSLIINFPNNPSGTMAENHELEKIARALEKHPDIAIIQDDVYRELSFKPFVSLLDVEPAFKDRTIVINSASKGLIGAPDLRIGMAAGPQKWIEAMTTQQLLSVACVSYLSQMALVAAVELKLQGKNDHWENTMRETYQSNIQTFSRQLHDIGLPVVGSPEGAFYLLVGASRLIGKAIPNEFELTKSDGSVVTIKNLHEKIGSDMLDSDIKIAAALIYMAGVATVPSSGFGIAPERGILRLSCAVDGDQFTKAIESLKTVITQLDGCQLQLRPRI